MKLMHGLKFLLCLSMIFLIMSTPVHARKKIKQIRDVHYGEVLYHFYQGDYFHALVRLMMAKQSGKIQHHMDEADLLYGGMALSYGMYHQSYSVFQKLLNDENTTAEVRDRAWYYLGKAYYKRGFYNRAENALAAIKNPFPGKVEDHERRVLNALVLMKRGAYLEADSLLEKTDKGTHWYYYARYNRGVALIKQDKVDPGVSLLEEVGGLKHKEIDREIRALKDRANLALGFYFVNQNPVTAKKYFQNVRLKGPLSSRALLGIGWAHSGIKKFDRALVPWVELLERDIHDPAVLEAYLAVPYALTQLEDFQQSLDRYENAITIFNKEVKQIDNAIVAINSGRLTKTFVANEDKRGLAAEIKFKQIPHTIENHYLIDLMASHEFQVSLTNFRDLRFFRRNLKQWVSEIEVYKDVLAARQEGLDRRLPGLQKRYQQIDFDRLKRSRDYFKQQLTRLQKQKVSTELATPAEAELLEKINAVGKRLKKMGNHPSLNSQKRRFRIVKGLILMDIYKAYPERLAKLKQNVEDLDQAIYQATRRINLFLNAQKKARARTLSYGEDIDSYKRRILALLRKTDALILEQEKYLARMAIRRLKQQRHRLTTYLAQAQLSVAQMYDKANEQAQPQPQSRVGQ